MGFRAAFYRGTKTGLPGIYNRLVRWVDQGQLSHGELIFSDGISASASFMDGGVRFKQIDYSPENWEFIDLPPEKEAASRQWFIEHEGEKYDLMGNAHFVVGPVRDSKEKWFCSEAMAAALGMTEPWRYGPNGLANILRDWGK